MSTRNEIKAQLRENTKEAFRLIGKKAEPGVGYTATALANMTDGRLSAKSIEMFFKRNHKYGGAILDRASLNSSADSNDIIVARTCRMELVHKTYVSVDDPNDTINFSKLVTFYYINGVSIDR